MTRSDAGKKERKNERFCVRGETQRNIRIRGCIDDFWRGTRLFGFNVRIGKWNGVCQKRWDFKLKEF
jgi:hypothetical protein